MDCKFKPLALRQNQTGVDTNAVDTCPSWRFVHRCRYTQGTWVVGLQANARIPPADTYAKMRATYSLLFLIDSVGRALHPPEGAGWGELSPALTGAAPHAQTN
jgi:hypothetical protein